MNGQLQRHWGWLIAAYLFLGGMGAGAYAVAAINTFMGKGLEASTTVGLWLGFPALAVGSLLLLADLGSPWRAILAGARPRTSWMARGFWVISLFMIVALIHVLFVTFGDRETEAGGLETALAAVGLLLAVLTMAYTGLLLGASKGIPFWRTGVVPMVFVISGLVTGHFAVLVGVAVFYAGMLDKAVTVMSLEAVALVVVEVLAIVFFLQGAFRIPDSRDSGRRLLGQQSFIFGYFIMGLAAPLALALWLYSGAASMSRDLMVGLSVAAGLLGLGGGLILRHAVLESGALPTLNMGGFEFRRIARPKEPRAPIGLVPPH
jgi:formate-dependent nitrite reductase membrane component NrfD